jgi:hypothetical protein|tara:strand:- start:198 stop:401 length:204 start_codon:yes stop_codon:yes gene_type:complete
MKVGDLVEVFYTADSGENAVLTTGLIINFGNATSGEDLVFVLKDDGEIEEYSMNIKQIKFRDINESR